MTRIGDYFSFQNGYAFKSDAFICDGEYRVIKIKEIKNGKVRFFEDSATINDEDKSFEKYRVKRGDVLFALTGDPVSKPNPLSWVGRVAIFDSIDSAVINQRVCKAVSLGGMLKEYLYYFFRQNDVFFSLAAKATGSASQANISTKTIEDTEIELPSLEKQKRIVEILLSIDEKIAVNEIINKNLSLLAA